MIGRVAADKGRRGAARLVGARLALRAYASVTRAAVTADLTFEVSEVDKLIGLVARAIERVAAGQLPCRDPEAALRELHHRQARLNARLRTYSGEMPSAH